MLVNSPFREISMKDLKEFIRDNNIKILDNDLTTSRISNIVEIIDDSDKCCIIYYKDTDKPLILSKKPLNASMTYKMYESHSYYLNKHYNKVEKTSKPLRPKKNRKLRINSFLIEVLIYIIVSLLYWGLGLNILFGLALLVIGIAMLNNWMVAGMCLLNVVGTILILK